MSDVTTQQGAEEAIFAAVIDPGAAQVTRDEMPLPEDVLEEDPQTAVRSTDESKPERPTEEGEPEPQAAADEFIEIPGEDGAPSERVPVKEALEAYRERAEFQKNAAIVQEEIVGQARTQAVQMVAQTRQAVEQTSFMLQSVLQHIAPPQPPGPDMLDPRSQTYNPDGYHLARAQYENSIGRYNEIRQAAFAFQQQTEAARQFEEQQRRESEDALLMRVWPESAREDVAEQVTRDLKRFYGITDEDIASALTSHKHALIARDALAYRAMMEKSPQVQQRVQKAAPKLVKSQQEAKGGPAQTRDSAGRYTNRALDALRKNNSDDAAAAFFAGLSRAGKI